jgi:hypothetical protein
VTGGSGSCRWHARAVSRRIGYANPAVTLAVYAHVIAEANKEAAAALAIEAATGAKR